MNKSSYITLAIHTYEKAVALQQQLETNGIEVKLQNVNLQQPILSSGVRVRIKESDLALALKIVEGDQIDIRNIVVDKGTVLIPIDFSEYSITACEVGFKFAYNLSLTPILLHVYTTPYYDGVLPTSDYLSADLKDASVRSKMESQAKAQMLHFTERVKLMIESKHIENIAFKTVLKEGVPEEIINEYSKTHQPKLIVMATRGKCKKAEDQIGSVTAEVLDSCRVPVFTVPENFNVSEMSDMDRAVYFSNLNQNDIISMDSFMRLFETKSFDIDVIPVNDRAGRNTYQRVKQLVSYFETNFTNSKFHSVILATKSFRNDLEMIIVNHHIKLLIVPNKKKNAFSRLFNPSIAHKILFERDIPMLVLPV